MKLERLTCKNWMKVRDLDLDLSDSVVHLFAGYNEAAKSSIAEAVRFALVGDSPRVRLKKDYDQLVTHGAKKGFVEIVVNGIPIKRDVGTGRSETKLDDMTEHRLRCASIALGAQGFVDLTPDDRRRMLFELTQVNLEAGIIMERLKARGIAEDVLRRLSPLLRAGVASACSAATAKLKELRAKWSQITGEVYGEKKAESWMPEIPPAPDGMEGTDIDELEAQLSVAQTSLDKMNVEQGKIERDLSKRAEIEAQLRRLENHVHNKAVHESNLASLKEDLATHEATVQRVTELLERAARAAQIHVCPGCGAQIKFDDSGEIELAALPPVEAVTDDDGSVEFAGATTESDTALDDDQVTGLQHEIAVAQREIARITAEVVTTEKRLAAVRDAALLRTRANDEIARLSTEEDLRKITDAVPKMRESIATMRAGLDTYTAYQRRVEALASAQEQAADVHMQFIEWAKAEAALSPDGIPGEILAEALGTINSRMQASAHLAGWLAPRITPEMEIVREAGDMDGLKEAETVYGLLSESARWRVSAIVADAISSMSGMAMLVLDRADLLDVRAGAQESSNRGKFFRWIRKLAIDDYDTILVMATLREKPVGMGKWVQVHWIDQGKVAA